MIKKLSKLLGNKNHLQNSFRALCSSSINREKWDLLTAVCLERKPVITPALNDLESQYKQYLTEVEFEKCLKSEYEVKHEMEMKQLEALRKGDVDDVEAVLKNTTQDLIDASLEELSQFKFANRITDEDRKNDVKSINRKLDKHLIFVLNQKVGKEKYFMLPQDIRQDGETLRQTAERVLKQSVGSDVKTQIYGNAPCGFYKYKYPKRVQDENGTIGAKVFFYFARYLKGELPQKGSDFRWLDRQELQKSLPVDYSKCVFQFLVDE
ncbi:hypothetical protein NQ318_012940 [Aromia moschata]|uniref:Large ribosomal subunit protein mL46 n=1 Tax=Aromia moschata TaxID=1265417 RepID=A0AAV8XSF6_9CUCU|nr:hypothetical protein NQ318_012940 [Aromia moschata]